MNQEARNTIYTDLYQTLRMRKRPLLVGINGAYTSGKTVFTAGLQQHLTKQNAKTQVIHYDDFHRPFSSLSWTEDDEVDVFYNHAFDPKKLVDEILDPLKAQGRIDKDVLCVDLNTNQFTNSIHFDIDENTIVLLEGVLLFRPPLLRFLDYKIFLDISPDEMLRRARQRDVPRFGEWIMEKFVTRYIPVQQKYLAEWEPEKTSDLIVDNNDYQTPKSVSR